MYKAEKKEMNAAFEEMRKEGFIDPELDLAGRSAPAWGTHSWRRMADRIARETMGETGVTEMLIDLFFGWKEEFYSKEMQIHYAGLLERIMRASVTMKV